MAVKLADTLAPMGEFPIANAKDIDFDDGESLQEKLDNGTLGGEGGDLTDYQKKTDNTLDTTDKTIVGAINEVKDSIITNYENLTNKPSIEGVELDGNKSLSDLGITMYDDTEVKSDIGNLNEYKQNKTDNTLDTTDKTITGAINEVNGNSLDTVGFSADYKNIILNRKN